MLKGNPVSCFRPKKTRNIFEESNIRPRDGFDWLWQSYRKWTAVPKFCCTGLLHFLRRWLGLIASILPCLWRKWIILATFSSKVYRFFLRRRLGLIATIILAYNELMTINHHQDYWSFALWIVIIRPNPWRQNTSILKSKFISQ